MNSAMKTIYPATCFYRGIITLLFVLFLTNNKTTAQNIGVWTLNNTLSGTGTAFNTVGSISLGSGIGSGAFNGGTEYYGQNGWPTGALNTNSYVQFSLSPVSGYMLNISTLILCMRRSNTGSPAGAGPTSWAVRSSVDGFSSNLATGTMTHNYANYTVTLTAFTYLTSTITFRIYGYTATVPSGGNNRLVMDNISVQGATGTLPVHFSLFNARKTSAGTELKWNAVNINAGTKFSIERSLNGSDFSVVGEIEETNDRANKAYTFIDHSAPSGKLFYRIRATEPSGINYRSAIAFIDSKSSTNLAINKIIPQGSIVNVAFSIPVKGSYTISLTAMNGAVLFKKEMHLEEGLNLVSIPVNNTTHGTFVMSLYGNTSVSSKLFLY